MNTGIGDAVNLAWKLAAVLHGRADNRILDTYEPERIAFARRLVATTDQAFTGVTSSSMTARVLRLHVVPAVLPALLRSRRFRRITFRTISQTAINYRRSILSDGHAGAVHGGDRLPWVRGSLKTVTTPITSPRSHRLTGKCTSTGLRPMRFVVYAAIAVCRFMNSRGSRE
jgi:hypothetical protein